MENPVYWGVIEHTISRALTEALEARERGLVGASMEMTIAVALRGAGLIDVTQPYAYCARLAACMQTLPTRRLALRCGAADQ